MRIKRKKKRIVNSYQARGVQSHPSDNLCGLPYKKKGAEIGSLECN